MRRLRRCTALATVLGILAATNLPAAGAGEMAAKLKVGDIAPDFTLADTGGRKVRLSSFAGNRVVLLAFWSLRCGACLNEIPYLNQIQQKFSSRGVAVLSVVTDGVDAAATATIMREVDAAPGYPVLVDPEFSVSDTYTNFVVPHTLVIDRKGIIRYQHTGFEPGLEREYEAAIAAALKS